jgi:hypothetical protein
VQCHLALKGAFRVRASLADVPGRRWLLQHADAGKESQLQQVYGLVDGSRDSVERRQQTNLRSLVTFPASNEDGWVREHTVGSEPGSSEAGGCGAAPHSLVRGSISAASRTTWSGPLGSLLALTKLFQNWQDAQFDAIVG